MCAAKSPKETSTKKQRLTPDKISRRISHAQSTVLNTGEQTSASLVLQEKAIRVECKCFQCIYYYVPLSIPLFSIKLDLLDPTTTASLNAANLVGK